MSRAARRDGVLRDKILRELVPSPGALGRRCYRLRRRIHCLLFDAFSPTRGTGQRGTGRLLFVALAGRADGVLAHQTFDGAVNGPMFIDFVRRRLVPRLYAGDVVVLDNLRARHAPDVRSLVEGAKARLLFLP